MTVIWAGTTSAIPASEKAIDFGTVKLLTIPKTISNDKGRAMAAFPLVFFNALYGT
jgi:hypothetical protein